MAALTNNDNNIAGVQSGAVKIADKTSPFESIFTGVGQGLEALSAKRYNDTMDSNSDAKAGVDLVASQTFNTDIGQENNIPSDVVSGVRSLNNAQSAVSQGSVPEAAYKVKLQQIGQAAMTKYPSASAEIANYFRASGHDHVMFSNLEAQQAQQTAERNAVLAGNSSDYQYYVEKGGLPNTSYEQAVASGQQMRRADTLAVQARQKATDAREDLTLTSTQSESMRKASERDAIQSVTLHVDSNVTPIFDHFRQLYTSANGNTGQMEKLDQTILPLLDNMTSQAKAGAHKQLLDSHNWTKENASAVDDYIDTQAAGLKAAFTDKSGAMTRTLTNLQATMGIDIAKGAPLLSRMSKLVGPQTAALMLDTTSLMDPKIKAQLAKEINGVSQSADGQMHLANTIAILKGDKNLQDFDEATAKSYIGSIVTGKRATEAAILNGSAQNVDRQVYSNSLGQVLNASHQLTPASDVADLKSATNLIATQNSRRAIDAMAASEDTKEQGEALGLASHLTGVKLLNNLKNVKEQTNTLLGAPRTDRGSSIEFDPVAGVYVAKVKPGSGVAGAGKENIDRVATLNQALDHAVKTSKWDTELPKATPLALRKFYAIGTPLEAPKAADGKPAKTPEQMWDASEAQLEARLRAFPTQIQNDTFKSSVGVDVKPEDRPINNPGNIRATPTSFKQYSTLEEGIKASDQNLAAYGTKHGINTISAVVSRWAPQADNNDTQGYIKAVAEETGYDPDEKINLADPHVRAVVLSAMFRREGTPLPVGRIVKATGGSQVAHNSFEEERVTGAQKINTVGDEALHEQFGRSMIENYDYGKLKESNPVAYLGYLNGKTGTIGTFKTSLNAAGITYTGTPQPSDEDYALNEQILQQAGFKPNTAKGKIILGQEFAAGNTFTLEHELMHRGLMLLRNLKPEEQRALENNDHTLISTFRQLKGLDGHNDDLSLDKWGKPGEHKDIAGLFATDLESVQNAARYAIEHFGKKKK